MIIYLDTSSLVKLYVDEPGSAAVADLVSRADHLVTSVVAHPEARAAFARLRRTGVVTSRAATSLAARFESDWERVTAIEVTAELARRAGDLADRLNLRGFHAIHLASFELLCERAGDDELTFSTADVVLARAARRLG